MGRIRRSSLFSQLTEFYILELELRVMKLLMLSKAKLYESEKLTTIQNKISNKEFVCIELPLEINGIIIPPATVQVTIRQYLSRRNLHSYF